MALKFFGRGSGFSDEHTSAYFSTENDDLVIIDCPISTFQKLKKSDLLTRYEKIYILITHTHGDHIAGLGLLVQYSFFNLKKTITIVAPSTCVSGDISTILTIEGNDPSWFELLSVTDMYKLDWFGNRIVTEHSPQLDCKCFGYHLIIDGVNVIYTGDTNTLGPFLPYLLQKDTILYVDTSVYYGMIHLKLEDVLDDLIALTTKQGIKVYLMHLDDVDAAEKIVADFPEINVVSVDVN